MKTYTIRIANYISWDSMTHWDPTSGPFPEFLTDQYPDCIISATYDLATLTITFKSEAHFTWFILRWS